MREQIDNPRVPGGARAVQTGSADNSRQLTPSSLLVARQNSRGVVRRRCFSLIEVVLGLGLLAFGILTTMRLLPISLRANRDSIAESYAADAVDEFLHAIATKMKDPADDFAGWEEYGLSLPTSKPTASEPSQTWSEWYSDESTVFWRGGSSNEYYKVDRRTPGTSATDFSGIFRVWRGSVTFSSYSDGSWHEPPASTDVAVALHVEVSWPAFLPYSRRQKSLYSLEVFKR